MHITPIIERVLIKVRVLGNAVAVGFQMSKDQRGFKHDSKSCFWQNLKDLILKKKKSFSGRLSFSHIFCL